MRFFPLFAISICVFADSDPNYRALRDGAPSDGFSVKHALLRRDAGTFKLNYGQLTFLPAVLNRPAIAVFTGDGVFHLKPAIPIEERYLSRVTGKPELEEAFESAVFFFSDSTYEEIKK